MPVTYARDDEHRRVTLTLVDPYTVDDTFRLVERQAAERAWQYGALVDARAIAEPIRSADVRALVDRVRHLTMTYGRRGPVAMLTAQPVMFGVARMYATLSEGVGVRVAVFTDVALAGRWLDEQRDA